MNLSDATYYDIFSATIDGEYSAEQIKAAAIHLGIEERDVLKTKEGGLIIDWLMSQEAIG